MHAFTSRIYLVSENKSLASFFLCFLHVFTEMWQLRLLLAIFEMRSVSVDEEDDEREKRAVIEKVQV